MSIAPFGPFGSIYRIEGDWAGFGVRPPKKKGKKKGKKKTKVKKVKKK